MTPFNLIFNNEHVKLDVCVPYTARTANRARLLINHKTKPNLTMDNYNLLLYTIIITTNFHRDAHIENDEQRRPDRAIEYIFNLNPIKIIGIHSAALLYIIIIVVAPKRNLLARFSCRLHHRVMQYYDLQYVVCPTAVVHRTTTITILK